MKNNKKQLNFKPQILVKPIEPRRFLEKEYYVGDKNYIDFSKFLEIRSAIPSSDEDIRVNICMYGGTYDNYGIDAIYLEAKLENKNFDQEMEAYKKQLADYELQHSQQESNNLLQTLENLEYQAKILDKQIKKINKQLSKKDS
jgi:hypothetical protein